MQISIIIPIYKVEQYIERCIKSVIAQYFTDYEVILVDDASPDKALQIAEKLLQENHITFQTIKHETNQGLSEARNSGIKIAKGKYIMFIDSDDELSHSEVLYQFYDAIEREQADFVTANSNTIFSKTDIRKKGIYAKKSSFQGDTILEAFLNTKISMSAWNKLINKKFLLKNKLFFQKDLICEDELWAFQMCIVAKKCYCLPYFNYNYYKDHPNGISKNRNEKYYNDNLFILKKQFEIARTEELINKGNTNAFISHFDRLVSRKILPPKMLKDKKVWFSYYKEASKVYKRSELYQYKKLFRLPAPIAYFVQKEKQKNYTFKGSRFYDKALNKAIKYNWQGIGFFRRRKNKIKRKIYSAIIKSKKFQVEDSIIICGERRSGTTWLLEIVSKIPNTYINFEPFNQYFGIVPKKWQWRKFPYLPKNEKDKTIRKFIHNTLTLKALSLWGRSVSQRKTRSVICDLYKSQYIVTKFVMANSLLPYIVNNFNLRNKPILIVRHPIDVCLSLIKAFDNNKKINLSEVIPDGLNNERFTKESDYLHSLETRLEYEIAIWCINMQLLLEDKETLEKLTVVFYSDLLLNPEKEIRRILKSIKSIKNLNVENTIASIDYRKPSSTDFKNDLKHNPIKQLEKNIEKLSEEEKERIQKVFDYFNFKLYDAYSVFPKKEYLDK